MAESAVTTWWTPVSVMRSMPIRKPADREIADRQPDLFDERGRVEADHVPAPAAPCAGPAAGRLTDGEIIEMLPRADMSNAGPLCTEVVSRRLETAVPALESLWRRFVGFGIRVPFPQQRAVLNTLGKLEGEAARAGLKGIVLSKGLPAPLLPDALRAAADAGLALPAAYIAPLLGHGNAAVREPAFVLAVRAGVPSDRLRNGLADPSEPIRRSAAVALGNRGYAGAMTPLIGELARNPSAEVIEALAMIADDDVIVHLGRCAERHPALADTVVEILNDMEGARAERLARRLEAKGRDRGPT